MKCRGVAQGDDELSAIDIFLPSYFQPCTAKQVGSTQ